MVKLHQVEDSRPAVLRIAKNGINTRSFLVH